MNLSLQRYLVILTQNSIGLASNDELKTAETDLHHDRYAYMLLLIY